MRRLMLAVMMVAGLGGSAGAQESDWDPPTPLPTCPGGVSLQEDPTRPGVILARYEDLPRYGPAKCAPYIGTVEWYVVYCAGLEDSHCSTYVYEWPRPCKATMAFRPTLVGQHMVFATWPGAPDKVQPIRAIYRKR